MLLRRQWPLFGSVSLELAHTIDQRRGVADRNFLQVFDDIIAARPPDVRSQDLPTRGRQEKASSSSSSSSSDPTVREAKKNGFYFIDHSPEEINRYQYRVSSLLRPKPKLHTFPCQLPPKWALGIPRRLQRSFNASLDLSGGNRGPGADHDLLPPNTGGPSIACLPLWQQAFIHPSFFNDQPLQHADALTIPKGIESAEPEKDKDRRRMLTPEEEHTKKLLDVVFQFSMIRLEPLGRLICEGLIKEATLGTAFSDKSPSSLAAAQSEFNTTKQLLLGDNVLTTLGTSVWRVDDLLLTGEGVQMVSQLYSPVLRSDRGRSKEGKHFIGAMPCCVMAIVGACYLDCGLLSAQQFAQTHVLEPASKLL